MPVALLFQRRHFAAAQRQLAIGQRVWKWQPFGGFKGLGTSPCSTMRWRRAAGSVTGTAESSASV